MTRRAWYVAMMALLGLACARGGDAPEGSAEHADGDAPPREPEGRVTLGEAAQETAGIQVEPVAEESGGAAGEALTVPGQVDFDPRRVALISPRIAGRVERLTVVVGDRVRGGQAVAELFSAGFVTAQQDFVRASEAFRRAAGTPDSTSRGAVALAAEQRLRLMGMTPAETRRLADGGAPALVLVLTAPFDGSIMEAPVLAGAAVEPGQALFRIADLSVVDVVADVPERALSLVSIGQAAAIELAAYPDTRFAGRVERLYDELDRETRTVHAVIHVPNPEGKLRPGMYASVALGLPLRAAGAGGPAPVLTVSASALVTDGEERYVFVQIASGTYERRDVTVASLAPPGSSVPTGARVAIRSGLSPGELVVVRGAFTLKSELAKASFADDEH